MSIDLLVPYIIRFMAESSTRLLSEMWGGSVFSMIWITKNAHDILMNSMHNQ
ncbi:hypothetical protein JCM10550A_13770 [Methanogenium cariaci]